MQSRLNKPRKVVNSNRNRLIKIVRRFPDGARLAKVTYIWRRVCQTVPAPQPDQRLGLQQGKRRMVHLYGVFAVETGPASEGMVLVAEGV